MASDTPSSAARARRFALPSVAALVKAACGATLLSLVLMSWSVLDPTPLPVMVSMSVGQAIGTLALLSYLAAVLLYQLRVRRARGESARPRQE